MDHVGAHGRCAVMAHQRLQFACALGVGRELRLDVGQVAGRIARRPGTARERRVQSRFLQPPPRHQQEVVEQHALFIDVPAVGRHGARRDPADVGVMRPRGHEKIRRFRVLEEHRGNHREVGQVRAAVVGRVHQVGLARARAGLAGGQDRLDAGVHRPEMHRHVRRVGHQFGARIEQGAGKVQPFLDVDRVRGVFQHRPHLFGNVHEAVVEHFQQHRIGHVAGGLDPVLAREAGKDKMTPGSRRCLPARRNDRGGVILGNDGRTRDGVSGAQVPPPVRGRVMLGAAVHGLRSKCGPWLLRRIGIVARLPPVFLAGIAAGLHANRFDHQRRPGWLDSEAGPMRFGELPPQIRQPGVPALRGNGKRVVRVPHADFGHVFERQVSRLDVRFHQFPPALVCKPRKGRLHPFDRFRIQ